MKVNVSHVRHSRSGAGGGGAECQPVRIVVTDTPVDLGDSEFGSHIRGRGNRVDGLLGKRDATFAATVEQGTAPKQAGGTRRQRTRSRPVSAPTVPVLAAAVGPMAATSNGHLIGKRDWKTKR
jgi:hypothetical protein